MVGPTEKGLWGLGAFAGQHRVRGRREDVESRGSSVVDSECGCTFVT